MLEVEGGFMCWSCLTRRMVVDGVELIEESEGEEGRGKWETLISFVLWDR